MGLLLAPYNNAMRLGQGFNSYTHEICIDDAVVVSPQQPENVLTNDGNTMRLAATVLGRSSAWTKQDEVLLDMGRLAVAKQDRDNKERAADTVRARDEAAEARKQREEAKEEKEKEKEKKRETKAEATGQREATSEGVVEHDDENEDGDEDGDEDEADGEQAAIKPKPGGSVAKAIAEAEAQQVKSHEALVKEQEALRSKRAELDKARARRVRNPAMDAAAGKYKSALSLAEMAEMHKKVILEAERTRRKTTAPGMSKQGSKTMVFDIKNSSGVSQTVIYRAEFIDKLSEITNDLGISAALSIQKGCIGGSGKGSFIDTDKFKSSDLNYYISVKVINQSINFRDCLEYNPLPNIDAGGFRKVFGDSFISGFLEGGELSALVTMKVLNKSKSTDIKVEGAITYANTSFDVSGEVAYQSAKANLELNTETTIQVSWQGGGVIKPPNEPWTIESLTRAAARFPDHVAESPQRTYAILTKYENLRSFQALKPPKLTPIAYENASLYTNELLDVFMTYKSIYTRLTVLIADVQSNTLKFTKAELVGAAKELSSQITMLEKQASEGDADAARVLTLARWEELDDVEKQQRIGLFPSSLDGLDDARRAVRVQMNMVINRVDEVTAKPNLVIDQPREAFLAPFAFEVLLPSVEPAQRSTKRGTPLTGERMFISSAEASEEQQRAKQDGAQKQASGGNVYGDMTEASRLCYIKPEEKNKGGGGGDYQLRLFADEATSIDKFLASRDPGIEDTLRLTPLIGNQDTVPCPGDLFSALDFVRPDFLLSQVTVTMHEGVMAGLVCRYANGLAWRRGLVDAAGSKEEEDNAVIKLARGERVTSVVLTLGTEAVERGREAILSMKLCTNHGNSDVAQSASTRRAGFGRRIVAGRAFEKVRTITFESPLERGYVIGFWGRSTQSSDDERAVFRLGMVWANEQPSDARRPANKAVEEAQAKDALAERRLEEAQVLRKRLTELEARSRAAAQAAEAEHQRLQQEITSAQELLALAKKAREDEADSAARVLLAKKEAARGQLAAAEAQRLAESTAAAQLLASERQDAAAKLAQAEEQRKTGVASLEDGARAQLASLTSTKDGQIATVQASLDAVTRAKEQAERELSSSQSRAGELKRLLDARSLINRSPVRLHYSDGKVIDHHEGRKRPIIHDSHGGNNQKWYFDQSAEDAFRIRCAQPADGRWWYIGLGGHKGGDQYELWMNNDGDEWVISAVGDGRFELQLRRDRQITVDLLGDNPSNGNDIIGWRGGKNRADQWLAQGV
ncbi:hypothetical protein FA10DRAFT_289427 [Acaromyces ingoldii]|uniref:Uncharacterized protein n=1 Tax=Acaromyces ingoldii TaxID=215250 RepID=A0A316YC76_9BASI|nr:hypothetical protein FA10DRAFT_289427 [Acaromyces ingoldii]PWN86839.1 hypothetical protein FA10DRAFT_289427 [Acaromyces ingoldii]